MWLEGFTDRPLDHDTNLMETERWERCESICGENKSRYEELCVEAFTFFFWVLRGIFFLLPFLKASCTFFFFYKFQRSDVVTLLARALALISTDSGSFIKVSTITTCLCVWGINPPRFGWRANLWRCWWSLVLAYFVVLCECAYLCVHCVLIKLRRLAGRPRCLWSAGDWVHPVCLCTSGHWSHFRLQLGFPETQ